MAAQNIYEIPAEAPLQAIWNLGNSLMVYTSGSHANQNVKNGNSLMYNMKWTTTMFNDEVMRRLVSASFKIFLSVQEQEICDKSELAHFSLEYRAALRECAQELNTLINLKEADDDKLSNLVLEYELINSCELIWHVAEIVFLQAAPKGCLSLDLQSCFVAHCPEPLDHYQHLIQLVNSSKSIDSCVEQQPKYWSTTRLLVLQGRNIEASTLLAAHSQANCIAISSMREILRVMPKFTNPETHTVKSVKEFEIRWQYWQSECNSRMHRGDWNDCCPELYTIGQIVCGDETVWRNPELIEDLMECIAGSGCGLVWFYVMSSQIFYTNPLSGLSDLKRAVDKALQSVNDSLRSLATNEATLLEKELSSDASTLMELVLSLNCVLFLRESSGRLNNWWLVSHLTDLLDRAIPHVVGMDLRPTDTQTNHSAPFCLRELFITEYAHSLLTHSALWQIALTYLDFCPCHGRHYQSLIIVRIPLTTERKAYKILEWCQCKSFTEEAATISRILSRREISAGNLGNGLCWAVRARAPQLVNEVADRCLNESASSPDGSFSNSDIISCHSHAAFLSEKMAFILRYQELQTALAAGESEFGRSISLILSLVSSPRLPRQLCFNILMEALPIIQLEGALTQNQIYDVMQVLENVLTDKSLVMNLDQNKLNLLQNLLSKALATSFLRGN